MPDEALPAGMGALPHPGGVAFRDMAKSIAGIDTLDAFLQSLGLGRPADGTAAN